MRVRGATLGAVALCLWAQGTRNPDELLADARDKLVATARRLPKYTCVQTIERRYFNRMEKASLPPSCDQISADLHRGRYRLNLYTSDRVRLDVAVSGGDEMVSWVGAGKFDSRRIDELVGEGPTGTGAFGSYLVDIFSNAGTHFQFLGAAAAPGNLFEYRFRVGAEASNYRVRGGKHGEWRITAYDGTFRLDAESGELRWLRIRTDELPPETEMCEAISTLQYERVRIGDGDFLLPRESELHIVRRDTQETTNVTKFSSCREYHAESTVRFGDEPEAGGSGAKPGDEQRGSLPEGVSLTLAFTAPIDTDTAAAGDWITAKVTSAVREPKSKRVLVPAGALARGRITRMRHNLGWQPHFLISILFETLEINGEARPFTARLDRSEEPPMVRTTVARPPAGDASTLVFVTPKDRYVVPAGYSAKWLTVAPEGPQ